MMRSFNLKRAACLLLAAALITGMLGACGKSTETAAPAATEAPAPSQAADVTAAPTETVENSAQTMAEELVDSMTLEEKIGQMFMLRARTWSDTPDNKDSYQNMTVLNENVAAAITQYNLSGFCLFGENCVSTEQVAALTSDLQAAAADSSSGIPLFLSIDQEGGYVTRLYNGTAMIGNMALAATGDPENARTEAEVISEELQAVGINVDFAPDCDINDNPENPVIGVRSFSDAADTVTAYAETYIEGLHDNNVIACLKHFPGHGNTATDSHTGLPLVNKSLEELEAGELIPFAALAADTDMIMTAHIQFPQIETETYTSISTGETVNIPATMSKTIITGILREEMGYDGVIVTDSFEMSAIADNFDLKDAVKASINAGVDIILMPVELKNTDAIAQLGDLLAAVAQMVKDGEIAESEIDDSVARILTLKIERGVLNASDTAAAGEETDAVANALSIVGSAEHHEIEWQLAEKAVTLYQDKNGTYSAGIAAGEKVLYLYPTDSMDLSLDLALQKLQEEGISTDGITFDKICYDGITSADVQNAIDAADRIILVTKTASLGELDTSNTRAAFCCDVLAEAENQGKEADVISSLLPYDAPYYQKADVILLAYNPIGVSQLPTDDYAHTRRYGANIPAAIAALITGRQLTGVCPVSLEGLF